MGNNILQLRGSFTQKKNSSRPGPPSLPASTHVNSNDVRSLRDSLADVLEFWKQSKAKHKPLVEVRYKRVIPKSGRIRQLLIETNSKSANDTIVGARFYNNKLESKTQHIITHCVGIEAIERSVKNLSNLEFCLDKKFEGILTSEKLAEVNTKKPSFDNMPLARTAFAKLAVDVCNVERFTVNHPKASIDEISLVTLFRDALGSNVDFLRSIGVSELNLRSYGDSTFLLTPEQYALLYAEAPQLIAMALRDVNEIPVDCRSDEASESDDVPAPGNEPWVGVIDTPFNEDVYFSAWVDATLRVNEDVIRDSDYFHGTSVTSLVVDGPTLNPKMDDGCGRFRVRHVGVAVGGRFSSFAIIREIEWAVMRYPEVKVWNLSLGSKLEISRNFISPEAAELDRIQSEYDVIFVVAGTNDNDCTYHKHIGAPADSINSVVVNSVRHDGSPCKYTRNGPVLSFFSKPDICYYGGDDNLAMAVCGEPKKNSFVSGTSFAAPWITRKLAYLIHIAGFSREVAKALLIDSACGWEPTADSGRMGYGIVPKRIEDILTTRNDEIKFVLTGTSELYDSYTHNIPVPLDKDKHPYKTKATLCYFPHCERNQGVDYTSTELSICFGRVKDNGIKPIDNNIQDLPDSITYEEEARRYYRKWDNVRHISEELKDTSRAQKGYGSGLWGISLKTKERLDERFGAGIRFGIVVTLHALDGVNRIEEFIQRCSLRTWIVNEVTITNQIDIYNAAEQEIAFE